MIQSLRLTILIILFGLSCSLSAQELSFEAKVSKKKLGVNENLTVEFSLNEDVREFQGPAFSEFKVLVGPNRSSSIYSSYSNGKKSLQKKTTYSYIVRAKKQGLLSIEPALVEFKGRKYQTKPIEVEVVEAVERPADPNNPRNIAEKNVHLVLELSDRKPFVGEQITASYKLYFKTNIARPNFLEFPSYTGFWSQDYDLKNNYSEIQEDYYKDELYRVIELKKVVLIPQKSGELELEPLSLQVPVQVPTGRYDWFGEPITRDYVHTLSTGNTKVNVKNLPFAGKPGNFSGAVGQFELEVSSTTNAVEANESVTFKVKVVGKGNLKLFDLPELDIPDDLEKYDPKFQSDVKTTSKGLRGSVSNEYIVIPRYRGDYKIPAFEFVYFDPQKEAYITKREAPSMLHVEGGAERAISSNDTGSAGRTRTEKSEVKYLGNEILFIKLDSDLEKTSASTFLDSRAYWIALLLPFLLLPIFILIRKRNERLAMDVVGSRKRKAGRVAKKRLVSAKKEMDKNNFNGFYVELESAIYSFLMDKLNMQRSQMSKETINDTLKTRQIPEELIKELMDLLSSCEIARYAPGSSSQVKEDYERGGSIIDALNKRL